jgi:hypothetical protein
MIRLFRVLALCLTVSLSAPLALAAENEGPKENPSRLREIWKVPLYWTVGLFRDAIDVPIKGLSSAPVVNRVLFAPLLILNTVTSAATWSLTDEGMEGGIEAWMACLKMERKKDSRRAPPPEIANRPWWACYLPNIASGVRILANAPPPTFSSAPDAPPPGAAPALPEE